MSEITVDVYRIDDFTKQDSVPLTGLLRSALEPLLGESLAGARFNLVFLPVPDLGVLDGHPPLINLRSSHGYLNVRVVLGGLLVYQHPHSVREVVARPLQRLLAARGADGRTPGSRHQGSGDGGWGFGISGPGLDHISLVRPKPVLPGSVEISVGTRRRALFHVEELPEPEPRVTTMAELGVPAWPDAIDPPLAVVLTAIVYDQLLSSMSFSDDLEEGGFFIGEVYRAEQGGMVILITEAVKAEQSGASMLHFTFTGESFLRLNDLIAHRSMGERLLGWYHTHLFPASDELGLSSIDVELHKGTFRQPWQVAGLVNIDRRSRLLRFYAEHAGQVVPVPFQVSTR
ncbi:hypothetical protein J5X84_15565 [Streptosporangiaceae bacterium NEAU-GS5]|nr:hypothetical protein [Streptosporangiaceae bacterium NEAU-GS5]